jgi:3-oxoacyl-[acyl-carrier protein] reductase
VITGGSRGIGLAVAKRLARSGHELILIARDSKRLDAAVSQLAGGPHRAVAFDVSSADAWSRLDLGDDLGGLVCAAAVLPPIGMPGAYDPDEFKRTLEINVYGTFLAIDACLDGLRAGGGAIVTFAGGGATSPLPRFDAYAASKAAVVRLSENLAASVAPVNINCVSPGFVSTDIHSATIDAGPNAVGQAYFERTQVELDRGGFSGDEVAELVEMLLAGVAFTGKLVSAQWDPWRDVIFQERLATDQDFATLRRIDATFFEKVAADEKGSRWNPS